MNISLQRKGNRGGLGSLLGNSAPKRKLDTDKKVGPFGLTCTVSFTSSLVAVSFVLLIFVRIMKRTSWIKFDPLFVYPFIHSRERVNRRSQLQNQRP